MLDRPKPPGKAPNLLIVFQGMHMDVYSSDPQLRVRVLQVPWVNDPRYERLMEQYIEGTLREPFRSVYRDGKLIVRDTVQPFTTEELYERIENRRLHDAVDSTARSLNQEILAR